MRYDESVSRPFGYCMVSSLDPLGKIISPCDYQTLETVHALFIERTKRFI
jgi:hypothetical protein